MISINKRIVPLHCSVFIRNNKYLAENADGSWYAFSTIPIADDKEGEWILNPKLKRPGNKIMVFSAGLKYPDNPNWMKTLQTITDVSYIESTKILKNVKVNDLVLLTSSQVGIVVHCFASRFRINVLHDNSKFDFKRQSTPKYESGWYYPSIQGRFVCGGEHYSNNGVYIGADQYKLQTGELSYEYRYRTIVNVISPDDITYVEN